MNRVIQSVPAKRDLRAHAAYLEQRDHPRVAVRFLSAAESSFATLLDMPEIGSRWEFSAAELADVRVWPVRGFQHHLIFYRPVAEGVEIVRVLHAAQDIEKIFQS
jgi:toxin ParE1/3/4